MRVLFTSDWQTDMESLSVCQQVVDEILDLKAKWKFQALVHCGDVKHVYNPVDVRVVNFILKSFGRFKSAGLETIVCLGNHDRVGMYVDKQNWLPVLRRAGAQAYDEPTMVRLGVASGTAYKIGVLPFRTSAVLLKREAEDLCHEASPENTVLAFHSDLQSARYNVLSRSEEKNVSVSDLCPRRYLFCVGGHIHLQQRVTDNVWYVGAPFATDWGEANQKKGYLLVDLKEKEIRQIPSGIPGWYDPSWPGFEAARPKTWKGTRIRLKVPCHGSKEIAEELRHAKEKAEERYKGAEVICIPALEESVARAGGIRAEDPDKRKLEIYTKKTIPDELKPHREKVLAYLVAQLEQAGGAVRAGGELQFKSVRAENFLSFRNLEVDLEPGLCVVAGRNLDWKGRSNGSGKSSYLQPLAVALFGLTFKGQKHDRWMRRGTKKEEKARVRVDLLDAQGREIRIRRGRQPKELRLFVDGDSVESGNRPEQTQRLIEQVTGYTWETLSNAIYIDQARAHLMLTGTEGQRKEFLAKLQNLERFERAGKQVKGEKTDLEYRFNALQDAVTTATANARNLTLTMHQTREILAPERNVVEKLRGAKKEYERRKLELRDWKEGAERRRNELEKGLTSLLKRDSTRAARVEVLEEKCDELKGREKRLLELEGECPTCLQPVEERHVKEQIPLLKRERAGLLLEQERLLKEHGSGLGQKRIREELSGLVRNQKLEGEVSDLREEWHFLEGRKDEFEKQEKLLSKLRQRIVVEKKVIEEKKEKYAKLKRWYRVLEYGERVFARNGLPAFLNAQLCPELNQAAEYYAELFSQGEIQVRFAVDEEGRMDVQVVNVHGGESVEDQSEGEMKIASLITSFAVRTVAPKTNLLILDEPGDGLDPVSARAFSKGLREVVKKFGTIILTSHNPAVLSELGDAELVTVVKENKISRVED